MQKVLLSFQLVNGLYEASSIRPFVQVSVEEEEMKTSSTEGNSPTWNEQLTLSLK